jgi:hypothetical protein
LKLTDFSILIPVFEETQALAFSRFYFDRLGVRPIYVLDSKRLQRREEVERIIGAEVQIYDNPGLVAESHFERFAALSPTDWVLRIDCDEAPTLAMLHHAGRFVARGKGFIKGYDRRQMRWHEDGFQAVRQYPYKDVQYRLFDRRRVKFVQKIHTPGYAIPLWQAWPAPLSARFFHLQFVFETRDQRYQKEVRYRQALGQDQNSDWIDPADDRSWIDMPDPLLTQAYRDWLDSR